MTGLLLALLVYKLIMKKRQKHMGVHILAVKIETKNILWGNNNNIIYYTWISRIRIHNYFYIIQSSNIFLYAEKNYDKIYIFH